MLSDFLPSFYIFVRASRVRLNFLYSKNLVDQNLIVSSFHDRPAEGLVLIKKKKKNAYLKYHEKVRADLREISEALRLIIDRC